LQIAKGHKYLLAGIRAAVDRGCDVAYTIAGDGPDRPAIVADVERLGLSPRVTFVGAVSQGTVLELLQSHDAFALPSVGMGEAAPVAVMEAMSCGLPVICSIIGGTPDMIADGRDGLLVEQTDEAGLANAVERLARDPEMRRDLGAAARERAVRCFDFRRTSRRLLSAIEAESHGPALSSPTFAAPAPLHPSSAR
jgi:glycosyltransferase involved in cell wall biosynthesis